MRMITSLMALAAVLAAAQSAQAGFADEFFEQQQLYGENRDSDAIRTGQVLHPYGFFGAERR